jgi:hypothetical protein
MSKFKNSLTYHLRPQTYDDPYARQILCDRLDAHEIASLKSWWILETCLEFILDTIGIDARCYLRGLTVWLPDDRIKFDLLGDSAAPPWIAENYSGVER